MKVIVSCPQCGTIGSTKVPLHIRDDGSADGTCASGHRFKALADIERYILLFESASLALLDEYYREALGGFAASVEAFYGFFIRQVAIPTISNAPSCPELIPEEERRQTWRQVDNRSERQLGAFLYLHLLVTGRAYRVDEAAARLRNRVIHKGYLPSHREAQDYGAWAWGEIMTLLDELVAAGAIGADPPQGDLEPGTSYLDQDGIFVVAVEHGTMLNPDPTVRDSGFAERLLKLRTDLRGALYGRGPKTDRTQD